MGNKKDSAKEEALRQQNLAYQQQFQQQSQAWQPSPYEQALNTEGLNWLKATSGGVKDVSTLPGMSPYIDIYNTASAKQKGQRYGLGSLKMGSEFANPNLLSALQTQDESHRKQDAGAQLEGAFQQRDASVRGMALPLINVGENRNQGKLAATAGMAQNSTNAWASHRVSPSFWQTLMMNAANGAASGAAAAAA